MRKSLTTFALILIAFGFGFLLNKQEALAPDEEVLTREVEVKNSEKQTYESEFGFSFDYSGDLKLENTTIVLPGGYRVSSVGAVRYVERQHCTASGMSEHCRPFLENPGIAFGVMDSNFENLKAVEFRDFIHFAEPVTLAGKTGFQFYAGVEGEGVVTIVLPFKENETLLIQYTFDEFVDHVENGEGLYKSSDQKRVVDNVLKTLTIK